MSNVGNFDSVYVGDLDGYISIGAIDSANARAAADEAREHQYKRLGPIKLLAGKEIHPSLLAQRRLDIQEWELELYRARRYMRGLRSWDELEPLLLRRILSSGRTYAIRRYARHERIPVPAAITASLTYGMQALMSQFLSQQGLQPSSSASRDMLMAWKSVALMEELTAYGKTGRMRERIYSLADRAWGHNGPSRLEREETRQILSLTRLHFSVLEMSGGGFSKFTKLESMYEVERQRCIEIEQSPGFSGIRGWQQRHLRPLHFYYPFALRKAIKRGRKHAATGERPELPERVANEAALAQCAMSMIARRSVT